MSNGVGNNPNLKIGPNGEVGGTPTAEELADAAEAALLSVSAEWVVNGDGSAKKSGVKKQALTESGANASPSDPLDPPDPHSSASDTREGVEIMGAVGEMFSGAGDAIGALLIECAKMMAQEVRENKEIANTFRGLATEAKTAKVRVDQEANTKQRAENQEKAENLLEGGWGTFWASAIGGVATAAGGGFGMADTAVSKGIGDMVKGGGQIVQGWGQLYSTQKNAENLRIDAREDGSNALRNKAMDKQIIADAITATADKLAEMPKETQDLLRSMKDTIRKVMESNAEISRSILKITG